MAQREVARGVGRRSERGDEAERFLGGSMPGVSCVLGRETMEPRGARSQAVPTSPRPGINILYTVSFFPCFSPKSKTSGKGGGGGIVQWDLRVVLYNTKKFRLAVFASSEWFRLTVEESTPKEGLVSRGLALLRKGAWARMCGHGGERREVNLAQCLPRGRTPRTRPIWR